MLSPFVVIFSRWLHVSTAAVTVGGIFFLRVVLPVAAKTLPTEGATQVIARSMRVFKRVTHTAILLLLLSGSYNAWVNWSRYAAMTPRGLGDGLFGLHLLLALAVFGLSLWLMAGKQLKESWQSGLTTTLALLLLTIASAGVLKYAREATPAKPAAVTPDLR